MDVIGTLILTTALAGIAGTGLGGLVGALLQKDSKKGVSLLLSFAGGVMLSVVCFDLVTEAIETEMGIGAVAGSIAFGVASMALSLLMGIPLGAAMARSKGKWADKLGTAFIIFIQAAPSAVYFLFIQMYFTGLFNLPMLYDSEKPVTWILPIVCLSLPSIASYGMWMRRYMVDQMNQDYVKLAKAKGVPERKIMTSHIFRNAVVPMVQTIPGSLLLTIMGSLYVESIFSVPGMGGLLINVIQRQDNTMVQALVLIFASLGIIGLFLGDLMMIIVDPRISLNRGEASR